MNRTAENLFWVGRYLERAENNTRFIDVNYHLRHEFKNNGNEYMWERLISLFGDIHAFKEHFEHANETTTLQYLTFDKTNGNSLFSCIQYCRNNIRALRQLLPCDIWDIINEFYLWFNEQDIHKLMMQSPHMFYRRTRDWYSLLNGTASSTMVRNQEWYFIEAGKYLERAENSIRILHNIYSNFAKDTLSLSKQNKYNRLIGLLKAVGGYEAFRKIYADNVTFAKVIEFLILDPAFPRSVRYSLSSLEICLSKIHQEDFSFDILAEKAIDLVEKLKSAFTGYHGENYDSIGLDLIFNMQESINHLSLEIKKTFFQGEFV